MKQIPGREEVIRAIDKAMSEESGCLENLEFAWFEIRRLEEIGPVEGDWPITSHRPVIGKIIIAVKRFFRKMLHSYIPRVVEDFNRINESQLRTISFLAHSVEELDQQCRQQAKMLKHYESILCETLSSGSNMEGMAHWIQKEVDEKRD
ncbi:MULTISPECIES: hypothetical protein [unclassified Anaerotruncus]|uniref:hypothetical protein n=1 Tax=unclassified Anaerotruncus TaxID=2641626 RepID=UPI00033BE407|nr:MULTISPECIES: hypothetical protein [unclassified Anaerotruncus]EOS64027.1 hypothetical protein C814_00600 [Anaerotruncus sp. G3(2012)]NBK19733.1 hypothetical protein [Anaerotruncus sp. 1XD42-93]NCE74696.1 hypothetical protein [Anaerotruncus sp. X29]RKJ77886.1 hypothetical protein D7Y41_30175 [Anaerotruncus sp. 1XD22-93]